MVFRSVAVLLLATAILAHPIPPKNSNAMSSEHMEPMVALDPIKCLIILMANAVMSLAFFLLYKMLVKYIKGQMEMENLYGACYHCEKEIIGKIMRSKSKKLSYVKLTNQSLHPIIIQKQADAKIDEIAALEAMSKTPIVEKYEPYD